MLKMVKVDMGIDKGVDKFSGLQYCGLRHHHGEQCVRSNVERNAKKNVGAALIELAREFSVGHVELEQGMAWGVPFSQHRPRSMQTICLRESGLVVSDVTTFDIWSICRPSAVGQLRHWYPYIGTDSHLHRPFIPNGNPILIQVPDVAIAFQKPQQFVDDGFKMQFLVVSREILRQD